MENQDKIVISISEKSNKRVFPLNLAIMLALGMLAGIVLIFGILLVARWVAG